MCVYGSVVADVQTQYRNAILLKRLHKLSATGGSVNAMSLIGKHLGRLETDAATGSGNEYHFGRFFHLCSVISEL